MLLLHEICICLSREKCIRNAFNAKCGFCYVNPFSFICFLRLTVQLIHSSYQTNQPSETIRPLCRFINIADSVITLSRDVWLRMLNRDKARARCDKKKVSLIPRYRTNWKKLAFFFFRQIFIAQSCMRYDTTIVLCIRICAKISFLIWKQFLTSVYVNSVT